MLKHFRNEREPLGILIGVFCKLLSRAFEKKNRHDLGLGLETQGHREKWVH